MVEAEYVTHLKEGLNVYLELDRLIRDCEFVVSLSATGTATEMVEKLKQFSRISL